MTTCTQRAAPDDFHGTIHTEPGTQVWCDWATKCCDCDAPAAVQVQGMTDGWGCEYLYFCADCVGGVG